ncbi:glycosyltransferase family 39 protein [Brumimicrobium mesophilum]|uniref:glycosyltransferase family 39 protein n=1 Tax=Brumimicrobium mesophilum TaxID=392717 RepID=UPI00131CF868|nr:glycosyltransferase family 39 protein [Brumimicrobium mesophilum]
MKKYGPFVVFAFLSLVLLWQNIDRSQWKSKNILRSDVDIYHTYLPAAIVNNDPFFEIKDGEKNRRYRVHESPIGRNAVKMSMGVAMMNLPFYYAGHLYALSSNHYEADGFSEPYQLAISLSSVFYTLMGLIFIWLILKRSFSRLSSLLTVLIIIFGTNLYFYAFYETGLSHPITFFLLSALLYMVQNWLKKKRIGISFLMGAALGLIVVVRPINILFILPILIIFKDQSLVWSAYFKKLFTPFSHVLLVVLGGVLSILPQLIFWKIQTGSLIYYSYNDEGFFWSNPHVWEGLFSFRKGWFIYTPLMFFALFGMFRLYKVQKMYFWALTIFLPIFLYVTFSWWCWWYGGSFGARTLVDILPFMAFPLAGLIEWILKNKRRSLIMILPLYLVYVSLYQSWQYSHKIIHYDSMTYEGYKMVFMKHYTPDKYWNKLIIPDYENAKKYGEEKVFVPLVSD